jgi:hypothetical protein
VIDVWTLGKALKSEVIFLQAITLPDDVIQEGVTTISEMNNGMSGSKGLDIIWIAFVVGLSGVTSQLPLLLRSAIPPRQFSIAANNTRLRES